MHLGVFLFLEEFHAQGERESQDACGHEEKDFLFLQDAAQGLPGFLPAFVALPFGHHLVDFREGAVLQEVLPVPDGAIPEKILFRGWAEIVLSFPVSFAK